MRILYISHLYDPEMGAQSVRVQSLSRAWVAMGHEVTVLTAFPNHPAGKLYPGWRRRFMKLVDVSDDKGVRVVRVAHVPRANRGAANRLVSFSSFTISAARPTSEPVPAVVGTAIIGWIWAASARCH